MHNERRSNKILSGNYGAPKIKKINSNNSNNSSVNSSDDILSQQGLNSIIESRNISINNLLADDENKKVMDDCFKLNTDFNQDSTFSNQVSTFEPGGYNKFEIFVDKICISVEDSEENYAID